MTTWFSATELAAAKLPGLPTTRPRASNLISRALGQTPELVRPRAGRGTGYEISIEALPEAARAELRRREQSAAIVSYEAEEAARQIELREADKRQILAAGTADLTARQRQVMEARAAVLMAIDARALENGRGRKPAVLSFLEDFRAGRLDAAQAEIVSLANDRRGPGRSLSRSQIYEWFARREDRGIIALVPNHRTASDLPPWFDRFLRIYARPSKPSIAEALREYCQALPAGEPRPTEKMVRGCLARMPQLARQKGRAGKLAMRTRMAYVSRDTSDLLPSSVYVADGKTFDAEIAHPIHGQPFRPELSTIIDAATRRIVGWSAALDENTFAVVDALRHACASAGIPAIFYTDRGPGYRNKAMDAPLTGFLSRAGITPMRALPYNSQAKGIVERVNQIYTAPAKRLPTYLGASMDKEAKLRVHKATRRELKEFGASRFLPSWPEFLALIDETISAYNDRPHSSLPRFFDRQIHRERHRTPNEEWAIRCEGFEPIMPDQAELDDMFRPYQVRRTRRAMVELFTNSYFAMALESYDGQNVIVGYDIHDASKVWVREIAELDGERVPGKLIAVAEFEGNKTRYVPVSYEQAAMERRHKGRIGRLDRKIAAADAELTPVLELRPAAPPIVAAAAFANVPPTPTAVTPSPVLVSFDGRPIFHDDVSFARWLGENPHRVTEADREYLRDLILTPSTNDTLRMAGLDLNRLRSIARNEPGATGAQERSA